MAKITIYTTPSCVYCRMTKEYFEKQGITYEEKDVLADDEAREEMIDKSGQLGVPVIDIDGTVIVGFDKPILEELTANVLTHKVGERVKEEGFYICVPCGYKRHFKKGERFPTCLKCMSHNGEWKKGLELWEKVSADAILK